MPVCTHSDSVSHAPPTAVHGTHASQCCNIAIAPIISDVHILSTVHLKGHECVVIVQYMFVRVFMCVSVK